jgi:peroxin-11B
MVDPAKVVRLLETTAGRDKLARTFQYACKFQAWRLSESNPDLAKRLSAAEAHSSMARKLFRVGKSLQLIQAALRQAMDTSNGDNVLRGLSVVQSSSLAIWLLYDNVIWAQKAQLATSFDIKKLGKRASFFWLVGMLVGIAKCFHLLNVTKLAMRKASSKEDSAVLAKRQNEVTLELVKNVFDLPLPLQGLFEGFKEAVPGGVIGLTGLFTSVIGVHQTWDKLK